MYKKLREPINSITHLSGALLSLIALFAMLTKCFITDASNIAIISITIFGISLILLYTVSGTYHGIITSDKIIEFLRKLDHSMIFILIAGSYAPFCLIALGGTLGRNMFLVMISIAIAGIIFKLSWFNAPRWLQTALYIGMGWSAIFVIKPLSEALPLVSILLLVLGGIFYTIGGIIYATKSEKIKIGNFEFHEIFHIFILLGSVTHFICVFVFLL